jgi:TIR domain
MYLAAFEHDVFRILQGCVRLGPLPTVYRETLALWWRTLEGRLRSREAVTGCHHALRLLLDCDGSMRRLLIISGPPEAESELRRYLASFTRLDSVVEGSLGLALTRAEHDAFLDGFPKLQTRVSAGRFGAGNAWFACPFQIGSQLDNLFAEADTFGYRLGYQVHVRPWTADPEALRDARKNALRVRSIPGVPKPLAEMQQQLVEGLANATALCEEFVAVDSHEAARWLAETLRRDFKRRTAALPFDLPKFDFGNESDGLLTAATHSSVFEELSLDERCANAIDNNRVMEILGWRGSSDLELRFASRVAPVAHALNGDEDLTRLDTARVFPAAYEGEEEFLFVSYKHQDIQSIAPILKYLYQRGINFWYDKGIPGGSEWDATLEQKLQQCSLVLLFVSSASIKSKYVRREAKYADVVDKPLLSIRLEDAVLAHGMEMLLTQYQMLDAKAPDFEIQLDWAIQNLKRLKESRR